MLSGLGVWFLAGSLHAEAPADRLKATQARLQQSEQRAEALKHDQTKLEKELSTIQKKLVALAEAARKREDRLLSLEDEQFELGSKVEAAEDDIRAHRAEISSLIASLIRLSRIPPEAVIAMPGELRHTMQTTSLLQSTTAQLQRKAASLTRKLGALEKAQAALEHTRLALDEEKQKMQSAQEMLAQEMEERKEIAEKLNRQHAREQEKILTLTRQSSNLQQLLEKLERERKTKEAAIAAAQLAVLPKAKPLPAIVSPVPAVAPKKWEPVQQRQAPARQPLATGQQYASFSAARGKLSLPASGHIAERYGQKLGQNQTSRGLTIAGRSGNAVLAPYAGEVVFTGPFLDYGRMVILRYDSGYHLLLAGLDEINCIVGQRVVAGEPVGRLSRAGAKPGKLYLELRHQSKPIDPAPWFG